MATRVNGSAAWDNLAVFAREHGWTVTLTRRQRIRLCKGECVVFAPRPPDRLTRADVATTLELMGHADGYMAACGGSPP
jgi:hypothetical protein